jgi:hypothetical protein
MRDYYEFKSVGVKVGVLIDALEKQIARETEVVAVKNIDPEDRRLRILYIDEGDIEELAQVICSDSKERRIVVPAIIGLPEGCVVRSVHHDFRFRAFAFTLQHESFGPVPHEQEIPQIAFPWGQRVLFVSTEPRPASDN